MAGSVAGLSRQHREKVVLLYRPGIPLSHRARPGQGVVGRDKKAVWTYGIRGQQV